MHIPSHYQKIDDNHYKYELNGYPQDLHNIIAVDVDDVILQYLAWFVLWYNNKHNAKIRYEDFMMYDLKHVLHCTPEEEISLIYEFEQSSVFQDLQPILWSQQAVSHLRQSYLLFNATARKLDIAQASIINIQKHFPGVFTDIVFGNHFGKDGHRLSKPEMCQKLNSKTLVDDSRYHIIACAKEGIRWVLMNKKRNQGELPPLATRVHNREEAVDVIQKTKT